MGPKIGQDVQLRAARPDEQTRALGITFLAEPEESRLGLVKSTLEMARRGEVALDGLGVAVCRGQLVAAVWIQVIPGNAAVLWPPRFVEHESIDLVDHAMALIRWTDQHLTSHGIKLSQAILRSKDDPPTNPLRQAGYDKLTQMLYLMCPRERLPDRAPVCALDFEAFAPADRLRMERLVERTYEQTRDCPALNGVRDISDVLTGYEQTGEFRPERWFFIRHQNQDVGCLLLTDHPQHKQWELVYMGIVPSARGNGWGQQITKFGQWLTRKANSDRILLAVDADNQPARDMYRCAGFEEFDSRSIFLKIFP